MGGDRAIRHLRRSVPSAAFFCRASPAAYNCIEEGIGHCRGTVFASRRYRKPPRLKDAPVEHFQTDPVQIYLVQMSDIPLLGQQREVVTARQIQATRRRFRRAVWATGYTLGGRRAAGKGVPWGHAPGAGLRGVDHQHRAANGGSCGVCVPTSTRCGACWRTTGRLPDALSKHRPAKCRREAWRRMVRRCQKGHG